MSSTGFIETDKLISMETLPTSKQVKFPEPDGIPTEEAFKKEKKNIEKVAKILKVGD
jgi:hypothetical protein